MPGGHTEEDTETHLMFCYIGELLYVRVGLKVKEDPISEHLPMLVNHDDGGPNKRSISDQKSQAQTQFLCTQSSGIRLHGHSIPTFPPPHTDVIVSTCAA